MNFGRYSSVASERSLLRRALLLATSLCALTFVKDAQAQLKIYYVRHAECGHNVKADWTGVPEDQWPDYVGDHESLTPAGKLELAALPAKLKQFGPFDFVAASPAWRARNTVLPFMKQSNLKGEVWPELNEIYNSSMVLSTELAAPTAEIFGQGRPIELTPEEAPYFSLRDGGQREFLAPKFPAGHVDKEGEAAVARLIQQRVIEMIKDRFGGSNKSILLSGHGSSGKGLLRMLTNDRQRECKASIANAGVWMVQQQPGGQFELKMYNDQRFEDGKPVGVSKQIDGADLSNIEPDKTVTYKMIDDVPLKLHCFEPKDHKASDQAPAVVFFFGGGWSGGSPKQFYQQARNLADRGMVAMSADYRVKSRNKTTPFECVADGKSAVRWVRQHAHELGIDPDRIVAAGGSAGGHVAACTGVIKGQESPGEDLTVSSVPNTMILFNPVLDTTDKGYGLKKVGKARATEISPCHHVRPGLVPTLIFHGTADKTVPFENANRFAQLMNEANNVCQLQAYDKAGHGFFNGVFFRSKTKDLAWYEQTMEETIEFLTLLGFLK